MKDYGQSKHIKYLCSATLDVLAGSTEAAIMKVEYVLWSMKIMDLVKRRGLGGITETEKDELARLLENPIPEPER